MVKMRYSLIEKYNMGTDPEGVFHGSDFYK